MNTWDKPNFGKYIRWFWGVFVGFLLFFILIFLLISIGAFGKMPSFEELENPKSNLASEVISSNGVLLGKYYIENRSNIKFIELSPHLPNAALSAEDIRFRKHSGIDVRALARVLFGVLTGNRKGGGSTITQQLAKNLFPRGQNLSKLGLTLRKLKEWVTATKLERNYTKDEIIAMYFNTINYGSQSFGIKSAAKTFFNKKPKELSIEESALLVGVVNAPTRYSPVRNPENALRRRNVVLSQMKKYDFISKHEFDSLKLIPINMVKYEIMDHNTGIAQHFREYLRTYLKNWSKSHFKPDGDPYNIHRDGLKIYTTIDSRLQKHAEDAVKEHLGDYLQAAFFKHWKGYHRAPFEFEKKADWNIKKIMDRAIKRSDRYKRLKEKDASKEEIKKAFNTPVLMKVFTWHGEVDTLLSPRDSIRYYKFFIRGGLMSVEPSTGHVKAYVCAPDYSYFKYDNVVVGKRQVGSTFKPFLYTLAMQEGEFSPCSKIPNVQVSIELPNGDFWEPKNSSDDKIGEMITLKWALANSNNWASAYLIKRYSPHSVAKVAKKMGVKSKIPEVPAIALGTPDLSLYEMTGAFNTFVNKGVYIQPTFITHIEDKNGTLLERFVPKTEESMSEETAYLMLELLKGVVESGTGVRLRYKYGLMNPIAGKTGTTQNQSDGWFMGMTPDLVTGIWTGCEDRSAHFRTIYMGQGANTALPIWALYMKKVYADKSIYISKGNFEKPNKQLGYIFDCEEANESDGTPVDDNPEMIDEDEF